MRVAYLGTSEFAATVLRRLAASPFRPALVIAPPDRPRGRGQRLGQPPVALAAEKLGLALHQTPNVNEEGSLAVLDRAEIDVGMVCAFGQLIKRPLLETVEMLNVHPSLLPRWRGAAPIERAIMAGDTETGVSIMRLDEGLDSGPVALCERIPINEDDDFGSLSEKLAELGGALGERALELRAEGAIEFTEQTESGLTYAEKIGPEDRLLDPARSAPELERTVRALTPHVGALLGLEGGDRLGVLRAAAVSDPVEAGALEARGDDLFLGTASGSLRIIQVKPPGKREMATADYLRGNPSPRLAS